MSVQEPQNQFEQETVEDEIEESQDSLDESSLADSASTASSTAAESVDVLEEPSLSSDDSDLEEESDEADVPPIESMPVSSSDVLPAPEPTEGPAWYVIHCYSGYENKVRHNLEQRIETMGMKDKIFDVVIPTQEEIEVKDGKRRTVERHIFPGYVLVNMALTEESWYVVRNTPGVTGFVGMGNNPTPLRPEEVAQIVKRMEAEAPTVKVTFKVGERVRIVDGPFNDFRGLVSEIDMERTKVRVMVSFFGRETPVELDFLQVEKA
jgi:transcription termination/antitermination protein NusG